MKKRESKIKFYAFLVCLDTQDIVIMASGMKPVISPTDRSRNQTTDKRIVPKKSSSLGSDVLAMT